MEVPPHSPTFHRILIIDDDRQLSELICEYLGPMGYATVSVIEDKELVPAGHRLASEGVGEVVRVGLGRGSSVTSQRAVVVP
jgi:hypothetical protein